jgi:hypothetical protein
MPRRNKESKKQKQPEFPGAPVWESWLQEQREAKKREIGFSRRIGRAALELAAVSVLVAKELPRALTDERYKSSAGKAKRLQKAVERSSSAEAIPATDLRKVERSRLRRLGRGAMSAINKSNKNSLERTSQRAKQLSAKSKANRQGSGGPVETWASKKLSMIDRKRHETSLRREEQFEAKRQAAWDRYLEENPDVKERLIAEQKQRDKQYEVDSRNARYNQMQSSASFATEYFLKHNAYSFSKALPRRPGFEGSYDELAKSSIELAAKNRQEGGSIALFSPNILQGIVKDKLPLSPDDARRNGPQVIYSRIGSQGYENQSVNTSLSFRNNDQRLFQEIQGNHDYTGGVATSLWKMGFINFESEESINYGKGEFNPNIEWSRGEDGTTFASIAYDPDNELHQIICGEQADPSNARIQLAINDSQRYAPPEMSVSLVEETALVHAA